MKTSSKLVSIALAGAASVGAGQVNSATVSYLEYNADGTPVEVIVNEPKLEGKKPRYQETLPSPTGGVGVSFRVEAKSDASPEAICMASQLGVDKTYTSLSSGEPVTGKSNVSYHVTEVNRDGSIAALSMMGFAIDKAVQYTIGNKDYPAQVTSVGADGASNYMMRPQDSAKEAVSAAILKGDSVREVATSATKEVSVLYRGGADVTETFKGCVNGKLGNHDVIEAASKRASQEFTMRYEAVKDASAQVKADLAGTIRDKEMRRLIDGGANVEIVRLQEATGGLVPVVEGVKVVDPKTGNSHTSFGCYAKEVRDPNGVLLEISASHTVLEGRQVQACLGDSDAKSTRSATPFYAGGFGYTGHGSYTAPVVSSGRESISIGGNNPTTIGGDIIIGGDTNICSNVDNFVNGGVTDSFNNCNTTIITPPDNPSTPVVPLPWSGALLAGALGVGLLAGRAKRAMKPN